jgi:hypothetical protein
LLSAAPSEMRAISRPFTCESRVSLSRRLPASLLSMNEPCAIGSSEEWPPFVRPRRKRQSDFDPYAAYVLKRGPAGERNGTRIWEEIAEQGYRGSQRMVYRFLSTLKKTEVNPPAQTPQVVHYTSRAAVWLFMQHPDSLDEDERMDLAALRQVHPALEAAYSLTQDFLQRLAQARRGAAGHLACPGAGKSASRTSKLCVWGGAG